MSDRCTVSASKYIAPMPQHAGDLANNADAYYPKPDYTLKHHLSQAMALESMFATADRHQCPFKRYLLPCAINSGIDSYDLAERHPDVVRARSLDMAPAGDTSFLTVQGLGAGVAPIDIMANEVTATNARRNIMARAIAARNLSNISIVAPADGEALPRMSHEIQGFIGGVKVEDFAYEMHFWVPMVKLAYDGIILTSDHAWSRNAAFEKGAGVPIQYGLAELIHARRGRNFDVIDIKGSYVSVLDQAWEDARHILDVVERGFRTEPAVMLMISRMYHDQMFLDGKGPITPSLAHPQIHEHYESVEQKQKMAEFTKLCMPYLAAHCDWPTLHRPLGNDSDLSQFWKDHIAPHKNKCAPVSELQDFIFSHLPRGGCADHPTLKHFVKTRTDKPEPALNFNANAFGHSHPIGNRQPPNEPSSEPTRHNHRMFAQLGATGNRDKDPSNAELTRAQIALIMYDASLRGANPPVDIPNTILYLDGAANGLRSSAYQTAKKIDDPAKLATAFDPLAKDGSEAYSDEAGDETKAEMDEHIIAMTHDKRYEAWRDHYGIGNIVPMSTHDEDFDFSGIREGLNRAPNSMAIAAKDSIKADGKLKIAAAAHDIRTRHSGICFTPGDLEQGASTLIMEAVKVAVGLVDRPDDNNTVTQYFFYDHDYMKQLKHERDMPELIDFMDIIILLGMRNKANLDNNNIAEHGGDILALFEALEMYEAIIDPNLRNTEIINDPHTGKEKRVKKYNFEKSPEYFLAGFLNDRAGLPQFYRAKDPSQYDKTVAHNIAEHSDYDAFANSSEYKSFIDGTLDFAEYRADPVKKAELCKMIWFWAKAEHIPEAKNGIRASVTGNLNWFGASHIDEYAIKDLHPDVREARQQWDNIRKMHGVDLEDATALYERGPTLNN